MKVILRSSGGSFAVETNCPGDLCVRRASMGCESCTLVITSHNSHKRVYKVMDAFVPHLAGATTKMNPNSAYGIWVCLQKVDASKSESFVINI